jgi:hypothetical protein
MNLRKSATQPYVVIVFLEFSSNAMLFIKQLSAGIRCFCLSYICIQLSLLRVDFDVDQNEARRYEDEVNSMESCENPDYCVLNPWTSPQTFSFILRETYQYGYRLIVHQADPSVRLYICRGRG